MFNRTDAALCQRLHINTQIRYHVQRNVSLNHPRNAQDAADESNMPKAWKMDAGAEPVNFQEPRL